MALQKFRYCNFFLTKAIAVIVLLVLPCILQAQTTYTSIADGNWSSPATWSGGIIPDVSQSANQVNINHNVNADVNLLNNEAEINVSSGVNFTINPSRSFTRYSNESFKVSGTLTVSGFVEYSSSDSISGIVSLPGSSVIITPGGRIANVGNFNMLGSFLIQAGGQYDNDGNSQVAGTFTNSGTITNSGPFYLQDNSVCNAGSFLLNSGEIYMASGKTFTNNTEIDTLGTFIVYGTFENNNLARNGYIDVYGKFNNKDTLSGDALTVFAGGIFENFPTGFFDDCSLAAEGLFNNNGTCSYIDAAITGAGIFNNAAGAFFYDGRLNISGVYNNTGISTTTFFMLAPPGLFNNKPFANITMIGGGLLNITGTFENDGTAAGRLQINTGGIFNNKAGGVQDFDNASSVINGVFNSNAGSSLLNMNDIQGTGTFNGNFTAASSLYVASPVTTGQFTINGNAVIGSGKLLRVNINGTAAGAGYDRLVVNGNVTLGGILNATITNTPPVGSQITIVKSNSLTGTFAQLSPALPAGWSVLYNSPAAGDVTLVYEGVIPLKLISFEGSMQNSSTALLKWITQAEINVDRYELQWSRSGTVFTTISTQAAANNAGISQYSYQHGNLEKGNHYYRLKMIDRDGSYTYSNIVRLSVNGLQPFTVYPNPVRPGTTVTINLANSDAGTVRVIISAADGKIVMQKIFNQVNANTIQVKIPAIAAGLYIITVYSPNSLLMSGKLLVE
jgi:Secretion system C-terminal sorting domain